MPPADDHRRAAADRMLALRARGDLESIEVAFSGQPTFVVKDPVAGEAFHLTAEEHRLLVALRQPTSLRGLQRVVEQEFAPRRATIPQLQQFVNQLYDQGLLVSDAPGQGAELHARGVQRRRRSRWTSLLQLLAIRVGGFDAGPFVDRLYGKLRWAFSPWMLLAAITVIGYAAVTAIAEVDALAARLPGLNVLFDPKRLPLWLVAIAGVKILHELGHALACRHFGARPREMGLLLLAGAPALYCDVSDAWRLPSKWRRMAVTAAGMFVETVLAAIALVIWRHAAPGLLSALCLSLVVVCSVGTLAINANPLVRFDGYYLLADWLETPNLADRARGLLRSTWRNWLLGESPPADPLVSPGKRRSLWAYAVLSKLYLCTVLVGLFVMAIHVARPRGLENAVYAVAALTLAGLLLPSAFALAGLVANPSVRARLQWPRVAATAAVLAALAGILWAWPMTQRVDAPLVIVPADAQPLFAATAGSLVDAAAPGDWVEAGAVVARLENPELAMELVAQEGVVSERQLRLDHLRTLQALQPGASRMIPAAAAELANAKAQLAELRTQAAALEIVAPRAGRVLAPPARPSTRDVAALPLWSGSPLDVRNRGAWIESGTPLAVVAPDHGWTAWAGVDQADAPAIEAGQSAQLVIDGRPLTQIDAKVIHASRWARDNRAASGAIGSQADAARNDRSRTLLGDDRYHVVELDIDRADSALFAGARGTVRISAARSTLGELAWLRMRQTLARAF
jgi:putative peptide zinc metalloprotease protein